VQSLCQNGDISGRHALYCSRDLGQESIRLGWGGMRLSRGWFLTFFLSGGNGGKQGEAKEES